jgi:histidinol-phosphate aminotransferase
VSNCFASLAAPGVRTLSPYVPGKPIEELERELGIQGSIKLASNENPLGPGAAARAAMAAAIDGVGLYPDGSGHRLRAKLAARHGLNPAQVTLGNGSNDLLVMLAEAFLTPDDEAVMSQYCFAVYPIAVQATGATSRVAPAHGRDHAMPLGHDLEAFGARIGPATRLVFIANPNNPVGTWLGVRELRGFLESLPERVIAVVDEAYFEYSRDVDCADASRWIAGLPNLVVTRTFSKAYGLAGLRVGYALSHPDVADLLNRVRQPFNVNSLALAAAEAALDDAAHLAASVELNRAGLAEMRRGLTRLGLAVLPSAANFLLADFGRPVAPVYEGLLREGVIVRPVAGYGLPNALRITVGTAAENARCLAALARVLGVAL